MSVLGILLVELLGEPRDQDDWLDLAASESLALLVGAQDLASLHEVELLEVGLGVAVVARLLGVGEHLALGVRLQSLRPAVVRHQVRAVRVWLRNQCVGSVEGVVRLVHLVIDLLLHRNHLLSLL